MQSHQNSIQQVSPSPIPSASFKSITFSASINNTSGESFQT